MGAWVRVPVFPALAGYGHGLKQRGSVMLKISGLSAWLCGAVLCGAASWGVEANEIADTIFLDAKIYTANTRTPDAEAMAVSQGRLLAVG